MITDIVRALISTGASPEMILAAVEAAERAQVSKEEDRLLKQRARIQRFRERQREDETLQNVSNVTDGTAPETKVPTPLKTQPKETPSIEGGKKAPKIRRRIGPEWAPSEKDLEYARKLGLLEAEICTEAEKFRDHHLKTGSVFLDWNAAWRTWCQRVNEFAVKPRANGLSHYPKQTHPRDSFR